MLAPLAREPHDDEDGHRDQPDDEKRLERCEDPARGREGKPDGEDRAEDYPDDPAHVLRSVADLARVAPRLAFGGPPECPERVYCLLGLKQVYGLRFRVFIPLDAGGPLTLQAGTVSAIFRIGGMVPPLRAQAREPAPVVW